MVNIIVTGTTQCQDYHFLEAKLDNLLSRIQSEITIYHLGQKGTDLLAEVYASQRGHRAVELLPNWDLHQQSAPHKRNEDAIKKANHCIVIADARRSSP